MALDGIVGLEYSIAGMKLRTGGSASTIVEARVELAARAKIMVGTPVRATETTVALASAYPMNTGQFNDLVLVLGKTGVADRNVVIHNAALSYSIDAKGRVDPTNGDLAAFAAAFRDGDGAGGYTLISGQFKTN
jgi:hypothetical protein